MSVVNIGKVLRKFSQKNIDKPNQKLSELKVGSFFEQGKNRKEFVQLVEGGNVRWQILQL